MNKIFLNKKDLEALIKFIDMFTDYYVHVPTVEVMVDNSSGIGSIVTAKLHNISINDTIVNVERVISSEDNW